MQKMEGLDVGWEEEERRPEAGGTAGTLREDGDDNRSVTSRRRPTPLSLAGVHSSLSNAAQPLPPQKLFMPVSWELKLMVTKSCGAGPIFTS